MTHLLWKYYWEDDLDKFRALLAPAGYGAQGATRSPNLTAVGGSSPGAFGTSPRTANKSRKVSGGFGFGFGNTRHGHATLGRGEINSRDHVGLTVLLRAASSRAENARSYVEALLQHPSIDIYVQDPESGWNALHRALYAGNISIARALLQKERRDLMGHTASVSRVGQLIKTKDHEGHSPFELYNSTIGERALKVLDEYDNSDDDSDDSVGDAVSLTLDNTGAAGSANLQSLVDGNELFVFGSNKNLSLGLGDQDDRQFPERVYLKRPGDLIQRFYNEYLEDAGVSEQTGFDLAKVPTLVAHRPLLIHDVVLAKLHSAVITADPVSNLYICGIGRGGRLGLGDENTRFNYTSVQGGLADKKVVQVALGQNHSMAITDNGELWTWGSNAQSQLGYALPPPTKKDEEPMSTTPRQVFGPLKKEFVLGIAASSIHSVAHTGSSLYCWGKNVGQLALMGADSRSLEIQQTPRKVAPSIVSGGAVAMVSAIDKATAVLLQNHSVYVLVAYGYVKLSFWDSDLTHSLRRRVMTRSETAQNQVQYIASGGDNTIAAVTARGDLFTASLDYKLDINPAATSTTNPSKIRGAVTQPQCIWNARKDGVRSVSVGENGSVIFSTQSGAVWQRIKRVKAKDTKVAGSAELKRKDFKFQRVPYITRVATVRASPFGAFAAIRKDSDVMRQQLRIASQSLWEDVAPLNCLRGFKASDAGGTATDTLEWWEIDMRKRLGLVAYEVLKSSDLDADMQQHLTTWAYTHEALGCSVCTSCSPDIRIPVHGWLLSARSSVLRNALAHTRRTGSYELADTFSVKVTNGETLLTFQGIDLISLLNIVLFAYEDKVIPAWNFTRQSPALAYRYRQIRTEVMRVATRINMTNLESSARLQTDAKTCMDKDFRDALEDRGFFEDGDTLLELDGLDVPVHSVFVCQRCPWFQGLFHGRSRGQWLASRRQAQAPSERVKIDLKHMDPEAFNYVLRYIYGDTGAELFSGAVTETLDNFIDLVVDVLGMADYLLLDRLSQICQQVLGKCVNTRNASSLLNTIGPCSIAEFKNAGLEYLCLQLENQLENHLLDDLDEDLLGELDEVVRANQTAQFPFARSGRAELLLHEKYPELAEEIGEERQRRVKEMAFKTSQKEDEKKFSTPFKARYGSLDESTVASPSPDRVRRASKLGRNEPFSPDLRPKTSTADLMFEMDEEDSSAISSPVARPRKRLDVPMASELDQIPPLSGSWKDMGGKSPGVDTQFPLASPPPSAMAQHSPAAEKSFEASPARAGNPWAAKIIAPAFRISDILSESGNPSALSAGLAAQKTKEAGSRPAQPKLSQKERKKQQQAQTVQVIEPGATPQQPKVPWEKSPDASQTTPWKIPSAKRKASTKDLLSVESKSPVVPVAKPLVAAEVTTQSTSRRTASPDTRFSGQSRAPSNSNIIPTPPTGITRPPTKLAAQGQGHGNLQSGGPSKPLVPHSKTYITPAPKAEPSLGLSMADIMGQQQREQERVREAVAKRSLQEIQAEQEFQEWWEAESRRTQEEEARRLARERGDEGRPKRTSGRKRGRNGGTDGGGKPSVRAGGDGAGAAAGAGRRGEASGATEAFGAAPAVSRGRGKGRTRGENGPASREETS